MNYPRFGFLRQIYPDNPPLAAEESLKAELDRTGLFEAIKPGESVVLTAGSRGIDSMKDVLAGLVEAIKARGGRPMVVPAMGSHGGGTGPGQVAVLDHLGIRPDTIGAPVYDGWEMIEIGRGEAALGQVPVYADKAVVEADHIILINRVKEHTEYIGPTESGLLKMAVVGLGRQPGAESMHRLAINITYYKAIHTIARVLFDKLNILGGVALIEDQRNQLRRLELVPAESIFEREPELLEESKLTKPKLPFDELDLLIIDQIGKEISGTGADTKVVGRIMNVYEEEPTKPAITRIIIRDLTDHTAGNAIGVGLADLTTKRLADKIEPQSTILNAITGGSPEKGRLPMVMPSDREALEMALRTVGLWTPETLKALWITDTKSLEWLAATPALLAKAGRRDDLDVVNQAFDLPFDQAGNLAFLTDILSKPR